MPTFDALSWRTFVTTRGDGCALGPPTSEKRLTETETALGISLPTQLRDLLREADRIVDRLGADVVWPPERLVDENRRMRTDDGLRDLYMPFDHLLFFGEEGGGDLFAFAVHGDGIVHKLDIFRWDHETDAREWYADRMERYLEQRIRDAI